MHGCVVVWFLIVVRLQQYLPAAVVTLESTARAYARHQRSLRLLAPGSELVRYQQSSFYYSYLQQECVRLPTSLDHCIL